MFKRKDGRWEHCITISPGRRKTFYSSEPTEKKALADIQKKILQFNNDEIRNKHNFFVLAEKMLEEKESQIAYKTYECYNVSLKHLSAFYEMNIEDITPSMVQNLLNGMARKQYSHSTIAKTKIVFGMVLDYAILHNLSLNNFMPSIKVPKNAVKNKVYSASDKDINLIIKNAQIEEFGMWAMILLCTGMRRGELAAIQKSDIDFKNNVIHVWRSVEFINNKAVLKYMPKSINGIRDIPILSMLKPLLMEMCIKLKKSDFIFGGEKPLSETMIKKRWKKYCGNIGIDIRQHQLRHAYAKILYRSGIDPKTAQGLLGHADIQTTMNIYTDFSEDVTKKSAHKIDEFMMNMI